MLAAALTSTFWDRRSIRASLVREKARLRRCRAVTVALGIGANITTFSLIHAILLRPFPYREPERLVRLHTQTGHLTANLREASVFDFRDWRDHNQSFDDLAAYWSFVNTLSGDGPAQSVLMTFASPQLFSSSA